MKIIIMAMAIVVMTGCATAKPWQHETADANKFEQDKAACMAQAMEGGDPMNAFLVVPYCLRGKGYYQ